MNMLKIKLEFVIASCLRTDTGLGVGRALECVSQGRCLCSCVAALGKGQHQAPLWFWCLFN